MLCQILQLLKLPDGTVKVLVEGYKRVKVTNFIDSDDFIQAIITDYIDEPVKKNETEALMRTVLDRFEQYVKLNKKIPPEILVTINQIDEASKLADTISLHLNLKIKDKQELLETTNILKRLEKVYSFMESEISVLQVEKKIKRRVKKQMEKSQKEYYLTSSSKRFKRIRGRRRTFGT
jgi:ATP-dependent Lon protease